MSDLIQGAPAIKAYIRVTDLVPNIDFTNSVSEDDLAAALPARDAATLFSSPICSRAVFNRLSMNRGISNYKIDPAFFGSYPELYDHSVDVAAKGIPLRPDVQLRLTYPKPLDSPTYHTYRNFIDFSYDAPMCADLLAC
ncbi:uncharacterized protein N7477_002239 [Penicillium maclennaniae]|uniref:uncharacterized protein n=1 Tax=Penicillium maclennaniae TaxID=1343394 RepID=UPI0025403E47|nr:uncharacterized protein N7477_002239 [Penicillium maclennaniae]KAJ5676606.1 hypothetical protein N7477_002239 [Penicillium maclennaniae]